MGSKTRKKYRCSDCKRRFPTENGVWTHISFNHADSENTSVEFECPECKEVLVDEEALQEHTGIHHVKQEEEEDVQTEPVSVPERARQCDTFKYACSACSKKFESENALWTHRAFKHVETSDGFTTQYVCDTCKLVFSDLDQFNQHSQPAQVSEGPSVSVSGSEDSSDISISDFVDDRVDLESQIILLSTKLTNELLNDRVEYLENKVLELQEYMKNLVDGLLRDTEPYVDQVSREVPVTAHDVASNNDEILEEFLEPLAKEVDSSLETNLFQDLKCADSLPHKEIDARVQISDEDRSTHWEESGLTSLAKDEVRTRRKLSKTRILPVQETELVVESTRKSSNTRKREVSA